MEYSEVDSRRFGMRIFRATLAEVREQEIFSDLLENRVDIAILRFPTSQQVNLCRLERIGVPYVVADTLVFYELDLADRVLRPPKNPGLVFEPATELHNKEMNELVGEIFAGYTNHYAANPVLPKADMLAGYCEWARSYCRQGEGGRFAWIVRDQGEPVAFLTCSETSDHRECEGILYGVSSRVTGRGIYGDLIRFSQHFFQQRGIPRMKVSTQVQNVAVQKAWVRAGFVPSLSFVTVHVNSFLNYSVRPVDSFPLTVSSADATEYGLIIDRVASRYFGTSFPGPGCIYLHCSYRFLRPILLSKQYKVEVAFPFSDETRGFSTAVLRVLDVQGNLCVLSYHGLRKGRTRRTTDAVHLSVAK